VDLRWEAGGWSWNFEQVWDCGSGGAIGSAIGALSSPMLAKRARAQEAPLGRPSSELSAARPKFLNRRPLCQLIRPTDKMETR